MNKLLFLDFDGVLFDTLREVYLVSRYLTLKQDFLEEIDENSYKIFEKHKYLVYNIWMFYYFNQIIFDLNNEDKIVEKYENLLLNRDLNKEEEYCKLFLDTRKELVFNHFDFWKNLEKPYNFFFEIKKLYEEKKIDIVVVSKKNKNSILERFETYNFHLEANKVFAREALDKYSTKGEFMQEYMEKYNIQSAIFVDDNYNNLKTTENNPNIENILALWGNSQPNLSGYNQEEAIEKIKNYCISK